MSNDFDNHGIGDNPRKGQMYYDSNFDKNYVERDRHGLGNDQFKTQTYYDPNFDKGYVERDRHGLGDDQSKTQTYYDPGFDKGYTDLDRHGIGAVSFNDKERFGMSDTELQEFCKGIIMAEKISPQGYEKLKSLPDMSIKEIIRSRYLNTANKLKKGYTDNLLQAQIYTDLKIILELVGAEKDLYKPDINISDLLGGENYQNVIGVLDGYTNYIQNSKVDSKDEILKLIGDLKEKAIAYSETFESPGMSM